MYMEFIEVTDTLRNVRAGDVMFKGPVARVSAPRPSRSGREVMIIVIDHGTYEEQWAVDPERIATFKRPTE